MATRSPRGLAGLLAGPAALAVAGMLINGLNLVMNLVLARVLEPAEYGAVVVQVSIFMILSVFGSALLIAVVQRETASSGDTRRAQWGWIRRLRGACGAGIVLSAVVAVALCQPVASLLSYPYPLAIAEATVGAAVWTLLCVERGVRQARGAYAILARNFVVEGAVRIGLVILFVALGLGVNGAGFGLVLGIAIGAEHARWGVARVPRPASGRASRPGVPGQAVPAARKPPAAPAASDTPTASGIPGGPAAPGAPGAADAPQAADGLVPDALEARMPTGPIPIPQRRRTDRVGLLLDTWVAMGALVPLALLQNVDVVIVGWLNHEGSGAYAAISTACKVPVFIGLAVANFLLPEAARRRVNGRGAARVLAVALAFVLAPGLLLAGVGMVAAEPLLSIVFGPTLTGAASALWVLALAMTYLSVTLMFTTYLLGAGQRRVVVVLAVCTVITTVGLVLAGGAMRRTAAVGLACQAGTAAAVGVLVFLLHRADRRAAGERAARAAERAGRPAEPGMPAEPAVPAAPAPSPEFSPDPVPGMAHMGAPETATTGMPAPSPWQPPARPPAGPAPWAAPAPAPGTAQPNAPFAQAPTVQGSPARPQPHPPHPQPPAPWQPPAAPSAGQPPHPQQPQSSPWQEAQVTTQTEGTYPSASDARPVQAW